MIEFCRNVIRSFLLKILEERKPLSNKIDVVVGEERISMDAVDVEGLCLICVKDGKERIVRAEDAADVKQFAILWEHLRGSRPTAIWEDGSACDISELFQK